MKYSQTFMYYTSGTYQFEWVTSQVPASHLWLVATTLESIGSDNGASAILLWEVYGGSFLLEYTEGSFFMLLYRYEINTHISCFQTPESLVQETNKLANIYKQSMYKYVPKCMP